MAYEKLKLADGTVLTAEHLAHIEAGIANSGGIGAVSYDCVASGQYAHAEGRGCVASGVRSHAEGEETRATSTACHAEGANCEASSVCSHAEGFGSVASGQYSHAEGARTTASNAGCHAEGEETIAASYYQHVQGRRNIEDAENKYAHIVGNSNVPGVRSNAHTLDWNGVPWFQGRAQCLGNAQDDGAQTVMLNGDTEIVLTDRTTGVKYSLYIENGKLMMEEVS